MADFKVPISEREQVQLKANEPIYQKGERVAPFSEGSLKALNKYADVLDERAAKAEKEAEYIYENDLKNKVDALKNTSTVNVVSAKGPNAFAVADKEQRNLEASFDKLVQNAPEKFRSKAYIITQESMNGFNKTSLGHQYKEKNNVADQIEQDRVKYISEQIPLSVMDPIEFNENRAALLDSVELSIRRRMGGDLDLGVPASPEVQKEINAQKVVANSAVLVKTVESLVTANNVGFAKQFAAKYDEELLASDKIKVNKLLAKGAQDNKATLAKMYFDEVVSLYGMNSTLAKKRLREIQDGEVYTSAISMYEAYYNSNEKYRADKAQDALARAQDLVRQNPANMDQALKILDPRTHSDFKKWVVAQSMGEEIPRNNKVYNDLYNAYIRNPKQFSQQSLGDYAHVLSRSDYEMFRNLQKETQEPQAGKMGFNSVYDIVGRHIRNNFGQANEEESASFTEMAEQVFREVQASSPERISPTEFRAKFDKELASRTVQKTEKWYNPFTWGNAPQRKVLDLQGEGYESIQDTSAIYRNYPKSSVEKARSVLRNQLGEEPTTEQVLNLLNTHAFNLKMK